ncbi:MAG TPA: MFS transporter [Anaerolineae bacterium]|nr:MFS transporter [Anaerolineae bacterium]
MTNPTLAAEPAPSAVAPADAGFQTGQVATIAAGHVVQDSYTAFLAPLLPLLQTQLGIGYALAGSLAIFTQLPSVLNPFIGYLADRISVRYFVILAPAVTATVFTSLGLASSYAALAALLLVGGIAIAAFHAPAPAMVARVAGQRVGTGMSIFMASGELARTVGPLMAVAGVTWFGLGGLWRMAAVGWLMSLILYLRLRRVPAASHAPGSLAMNAFWRQARRVFPALIWLLGGRSLMVAALSTYLPIFMSDERQSNLWLAAAALTILQGAGVVGALAAGTLSDRWGRRRVLLAVTVTAPFLLLAFIYSPAWLAVPLLIALGLASLSTQPVVLALVQDQFPHNRAFANGVNLAITFMLQAAAIWAVGALADRYGLTPAYAVSALLALVSIPAVFFLPTRRV